MPKASTGYEVITQQLTGNDPVTLTAPEDTFVVWAYALRNQTGNLADGSIEAYVNGATVSVIVRPIPDVDGNITAVEFHDPNGVPRTITIICIGK